MTLFLSGCTSASFFLLSEGWFITKGEIGLRAFLEIFMRDVDRGDLGVCGVSAGVDWIELSEVLKENIDPFEESFVDGDGEVVRCWIG